MNNRFPNRIVLVTGGGTGIGRAVASAFAAEGATVVVTGRRQAPLRETAEAIRAAGGSADFVTGDVTVEADVERVVATVVDRHDRLDIAVNNAGVAVGGPLTRLELSDWRRLFDANVTGVMLSMKHELRQFQRQGGGVVVNVGSNLGAHNTSVPGLAAYGASKAAVSALSRAAAFEHIGDGIRINVVSPGPSDTHMSMRPGETAAQRDERMAVDLPLGRVGRLAEVASAVLWLAAEESGFAVGHDLVVDGGASL